MLNEGIDENVILKLMDRKEQENGKDVTVTYIVCTSGWLCKYCNEFSWLYRASWYYQSLFYFHQKIIYMLPEDGC